jgi:hypothetical protein
MIVPLVNEGFLHFAIVIRKSDTTNSHQKGRGKEKSSSRSTIVDPVNFRAGLGESPLVLKHLGRHAKSFGKAAWNQFGGDDQLVGELTSRQ